MPIISVEHIQGEKAGSSQDFSGDVVTVGRASECDLSFDEMGISWTHAEIRFRDGAFWVVDQGSTNGTYVNDERASNAKLKDGDVLRFGKKGPTLKVKFQLEGGEATPKKERPQGAPDESAATSHDGDDDEKEKGPSKGEPDVPKDAQGVPIIPVGSDSVEDPATPRPLPDPNREREEREKARAPQKGKTTAAAAPDDLTKSLEPPKQVAVAVSAKPPRKRLPSEPDHPVLNQPVDARSDLPPAALPPRGRGAIVAVMALTVLLCLVLVMGVALYIAMDGELRTETDRRQRADEELRRVKEERSKEIEAAREEGKRLVEGMANANAERMSRELAETQKRAQAREEELLATIKRQEAEIADLRLRRPGQASGGVDWKSIEKKIDRSVLFVCVRMEGVKKNGERVDLSCSGTGFFVSKQGLLITNKHVLQPWKFRELAERMAHEGIEVDEKTYQIHAWPAGSSFLKRGENGKPELDVSTAFSTSTHTLELVRTSPDRWYDVSLGGDSGARKIRIHHDGGNEDLALLRASAPAGRTLDVEAVQTSPSDSVERLDEVMVVGFPAGFAVLEAGVAETSPSLGQVRKVEQTIMVTAGVVGGNSGGPLVDRRGRVVGVITRVLKGTETLGSCLRIEHAIQLTQGGVW